MRGLLWVLVLAGCITENNPSVEGEDGGAGGAGGAGAGGAGDEGGECRFAWAALPDAVRFGRVTPFETLEITVDFKNSGDCDLTLGSVQVNGPRAFGVRVDGVDPRVDPAVLATPIAPGAARSVVVTFTAPAEPGAARGELVVTSEAGMLVVPLSANDGPCLRTDPSALALRSTPGVVVAGSVTVGNCGPVAMGLEAANLGGGQAGAFRVAGGVPAVLPPGGEVTVEVAFEPPAPGAFEARLEIITDSADLPVISVGLQGQALENECPVASVGPLDEVRAEPGEIVMLDGSASRDVDGPDGRPVRWAWIVVARPDGSTALPAEQFQNPNDPANSAIADDALTDGAVFAPDLAGRYVLQLRVTDANGCEATADLVIIATPPTDIEVQLTWVGAGDLDLHLRHPHGEDWFAEPYDCFFGNPQPDWGQLENPADDPTLDRDVAVAGPEIIRLTGAEDTGVLGGPYRVGVSLDDGIGAAVATVRVLVRGVLVAEVMSELSPVNPFFDAAEIAWPPP